MAVRRGSGSSLARAQSGIPTGTLSGTGPSAGSGSGSAAPFSFSFDPAAGAPPTSFAPPTGGGSGVPAFSFSPAGSSSSTTSSSSSSSAFAFSFPSSSSSSSATPPSFTSSASSPAFSFGPPPPSASSSAAGSAPLFTFPNPSSSSSPSQASSSIFSANPASHVTAGSPARPPPGAAGSRSPPSPSAAGDDPASDSEDNATFNHLLHCTTQILNKIGPRNFEPMVRELADHVTGQCVHDGKQGLCGRGLQDGRMLWEFASTVVEKALDEPNYGDIYAQACRVILPFCPAFEQESLDQCLFESCETTVEDYLEAVADDEEGDASEAEQKELRLRALGAIEFAAELYNCGMLPSANLVRLLSQCVEQAETAELCCRGLRLAGPTLDYATEDAVAGKCAPPFFSSREEALEVGRETENVYDALLGLVKDDQLHDRVVQMVRQLLDRREAGWEDDEDEDDAGDGHPVAPPAHAPAPTPAAGGATAARRPIITARRSLSGTGTGAGGPAASGGSPAAASSTPPTQRRQQQQHQQQQQSPTAASSSSSSPSGPSGPQSAEAEKMMQKRDEIRHVAVRLVHTLKEALGWAADAERRLQLEIGEGREPPMERVELLNQAFLGRLGVDLERLQREFDREVPVVRGLLAFLGKYVQEVTAREGGDDRAPFRPHNMVHLKAMLIARIEKVEQIINGSSAAQPPAGPAGGPAGSSAAPFPTPAAGPMSAPAPAASARSTQPQAAAAAVGPQQRTTTAAPAPSDELPPNWVNPDLQRLARGLPLDQLLRGWEEELVSRVTSLHRDARTVAMLDNASLSIDKSLGELASRVDRVSLAQAEVDKGLDMIHHHQMQFHELLQELEEQAHCAFSENELDGSFYAVSAAAADAETQRDASYQSAREVDVGLHDVEKELKRLVDEFNDGVTYQRANHEYEVAELEEILNNSLSALQWMTTTSNVLERKLRRLQALHTTSDQPQTPQ